jgi:uncharacterized membrane protein YhiD involved in acid resistance
MSACNPEFWAGVGTGVFAGVLGLSTAGLLIFIIVVFRMHRLADAAERNHNFQRGNHE